MMVGKFADYITKSYQCFVAICQVCFFPQCHAVYVSDKIQHT